jgi:glucose-1-phosphate cytidylyltransferase
MKVVLFCGGMGMRLREHAESLPKPLVTVGPRPILWNLMKYYAHFGHREFILCLGHGAEAIKNYFLDYDERLSNDFVLRKGGADVQLLGRDIDTGLRANIGMRLRAVRSHLEGEDAFLANYADGLSDLPLDRYLTHFREHGKIASMLSVPAPQTVHMIHAEKNGLVQSIEHVSSSELRMNAGFFAFRREIFDYIGEGEELVVEPFSRLIQARELVAYPHDGFWMAMDTFKDKQQFEALVANGTTPWKVWK